MNDCCLRPATWAVTLLALTSMGGLAFAASAAQPPAIPAQEQPEVLSRGPVHEAFAEPVNLQFQAGLIAPERPPPNIEEIPPEERPQGQQFVWIPGYWSWDADRNGYIWVSACWRAAPPGMSWVPGYWSQVSGGWEWVAGFWTPAGVREIEYLPEPPTVAELEPYGTSPSQDTIWVPPCMYWVQGQYVRRPGYWLAAQAHWVWVPSHYIMTPRGYLFAAGHWDYALDRRGVLFAPVYFPATFYGRLGVTFSPSIIIDMGLLQISLFAYPRYHHYYFGDYYDNAYLSIGIYPWFDSQRYHTWYDPVYEHSRWRYRRSEPRWDERQRHEYDRRRDNRDLRPARTFREQEYRVARLPETQRQALQVTQPITAIAARREKPMKFERIDTGERQKISKQATAVHTFRDERSRWEAPSAGSQKTVQPSGERKVTAPPQTGRQETVPLVRERNVPAPPPQTGRKETVPPVRERNVPATPQPAKREPAIIPVREPRVSQPERVKIPASPVFGRPEKTGIFQKGPPSQPDDEGRNKEGKGRRK